MKARHIKKRTLARMLHCEVLTFSWVCGPELVDAMRALVNNPARLLNAIRSYAKAVA